MTRAFSMPALGKGSVASFVKMALDVAWVLLWVAAAGLGLGALAYAAALVLIQTGQLPADALQPGAARFQFGPVSVETDAADDLAAHVVAPAFLAAAVAIGGALVIVTRLKALFKSFTSGEPFLKENASHLRAIWITMLVMELSRYAIAGLVATLIAVFGQPERAEVLVEAPVNLATWGAICILIVLAEVFREGSRLREEQELTI